MWSRAISRTPPSLSMYLQSDSPLPGPGPASRSLTSLRPMAICSPPETGAGTRQGDPAPEDRRSGTGAAREKACRGAGMAQTTRGRGLDVAVRPLLLSPRAGFPPARRCPGRTTRTSAQQLNEWEIEAAISLVVHRRRDQGRRSSTASPAARCGEPIPPARLKALPGSGAVWTARHWPSRKTRPSPTSPPEAPGPGAFRCRPLRRAAPVRRVSGRATLRNPEKSLRKPPGFGPRALRW